MKRPGFRRAAFTSWVREPLRAAHSQSNFLIVYLLGEQMPGLMSEPDRATAALPSRAFRAEPLPWQMARCCGHTPSR